MPHLNTKKQEVQIIRQMWPFTIFAPEYHASNDNDYDTETRH